MRRRRSSWWRRRRWILNWARSGSRANKIACRIPNSLNNHNKTQRHLNILEGRRLPGAAVLLESFRDGQNEFVVKWPADYLNADGQTFVRMADGNCGPWET